MYTHCPECRASFRVTADVLQQAAGRVRCGGCGHAFNALERLSEVPPAGGDRHSGGGSGTLLDDFDALSETDNVRIEDTGVEWQVVEEEERAGTGSQESLYLVSAPDAAEERYDDNTPLPEVQDDDEELPPPESPRRRAEDLQEPRPPELDERQVDLALSEPEDWTDLLDEVDDPAATIAQEHAAATDDRQQDEDTHTDLEVLEAETGEHQALEAETGEQPALETIEAETGEDLAPETIEAETGEHPALEAPEAETGEHPAVEARDDESDAEQPVLEEDDAGGDLALVEDAEAAPEAGDGEHYVPPPTEEEMTINRLIDQDLLRLSGEQRDLAATSSGMEVATSRTPPHVETIIMEGDFVRSSLEANDAVAGRDARPELEDTAGDVLDPRDTYVQTRGSARAAGHAESTRRYAAVAGVGALALLLCAQVVHAYRETLATYGVIGESLASLYDAAGASITPDWDVDGWQFHNTRGSTDAGDRVLTISSTLVNASEHALPYPLLHVALTDRYEEIVASQLLEAGRYLEIRAADGRVAPGGKLNASVTIAPLSPQAEGYKLNVCYPLGAGKVRCATGAFE